MKTLHINVADKIATYQKRDGDIVCGNSDYQIEFTFDEEWAAATTKTARFIINGEHHDKNIKDGICAVPTLTNVEQVEVGVYADGLKTTTGATIGCKRSILCKGTTPSTENDKDYANEAKEAADRAEAAADKAIIEAEINEKGELVLTKGDGAEDNLGNVVAGFGTPTASVNAYTGTPSVTVTASGPDTAKVFHFAFKNLKGENYKLTDDDKQEIALLALDLLENAEEQTV